jgi:peptidoglycan/xylan/chitin deacetylase (PgdA/CDA1 family)
MPWKDRYTISDEKSLLDQDVVWPNGKRCCFRVVIDLSPPCGPQGITAKNVSTPEAHFGMHGGLAALRDLLNRHNVRATCAVSAVTAELYPDKIRALRDDGHEIAAHGFKREDVTALDRADEQARLERTTEILTAITGERPTGWFSLARQGDKFAGGSLSPNTMDLLIDAGYAYFGNSLADDAPHYWVTDFASRRAILALPYYYHFDDQFFLLFPHKGTGLENPEGLFRNCKAELEAQYKRGRQFAITLHPYAIGWPNRLLRLEAFLDLVRSLRDVWNPTSHECAAHWAQTYPRETHLKLKPSIWQDYPGSLS